MGAKWRVFMDTSALVAGLYSPTGAAREVLRLAEAHVIELVISEQVLVEADRTLAAKLPNLLQDFRVFLKQLAPVLVEDPARRQVEEAEQWIDRHDAPILAAAREAQVDYLVTWNTRHFVTAKVRAAVEFPVGTPGDFLAAFRERLLSDQR